MAKRSTPSGFSLVELSIVLVILGLLTGGILAGQSLIRAAELRGALNEYQRYFMSSKSFVDRYFALPGDFSRAQSFWGVSSLPCNTTCTNAQSTGTCNGNGNGIIEHLGSPNLIQENYYFWQHLALAGLIEGNYTGRCGAAGSINSIPNQNIPASRLGRGGWNANTYTLTTGHAVHFNIASNENRMFLGVAQANNWATGAIMLPEEAWNLDVKVDDGKPAIGNMITRYWDDCTNAVSGATLSADYLLTHRSPACTIEIKGSF